jgi:hypothetical protein
MHNVAVPREYPVTLGYPVTLDANEALQTPLEKFELDSLVDPARMAS